MGGQDHDQILGPISLDVLFVICVICYVGLLFSKECALDS